MRDRRHIPITAPQLAMLAVGLCMTGSLGADVVELKEGGQIRGEIVRDDSASRTELTVLSPLGRVVIDRARVERMSVESPAEVEYRRRAPAVSDTVEGQYAFALWCRDNGLGDAMRRHLERVLALDHDHEASRRLLGYQRIAGQWLDRDQRLAARGLVRYQGDYRTQQEIELLKRQVAIEDGVREWSGKMDGLRKALLSNDPDLARQATDTLHSLDDPLAAGPLSEWLDTERDPAIKRLLLQSAGTMDHPATLGVLARIALDDPDAESRVTAIEQLAASRAQGLSAPFVAALTAKSNAKINRAGDALAVLGGSGELAPLIEALVTTHKFRTGNDSGGDSYAFNPGSGQFSFGGNAPKVVTQRVNNPRVLAALVELTGVNYSFDQQRWRAWLASQQVAAQVDLRRDP
ncbi:HEAT repeat domain-containing protein [Botrimarina hoheduenensis]|uniref:HEAT repeat protein n=1 Tax=Botrimarina hoheduenensis TaxID=2528000 RepID=A0A5C5W6A9_9BACT|nr:HEAT repeat domain-containing protein [Botrimarina hoheduenensis]TWT46508.1 hypothetical protein Pla111_16040 [Botrimarina hoheduenensis]